MLINQPIYYRMAELGKKWENDTLDATELHELRESLKKHAQIMMDVVTLNNMSMAAHIGNDTDWQHRICEATEMFATTGLLPTEWLTDEGGDN
ncbi:hypothetical protein D3C75_474250 [compost metagenome]